MDSNPALPRDETDATMQIDPGANTNTGALSPSGFHEGEVNEEIMILSSDANSKQMANSTSLNLKEEIHDGTSHRHANMSPTDDVNT